MANQSQKGGGNWSSYFSNMYVRRGWESMRAGEPFNDAAYKLFPAITPEVIAKWSAAGHDLVASIQRQYEAGRLLAAEASDKALPAPAKRRTKEIDAVVAACPAMVKQFATEQALAREEAKRAAALRMRLMAAERRKSAAPKFEWTDPRTT